MPYPIDIDEIARFHGEEVGAVRFPDSPTKPRRDNYNSHADYGKALDEYEVLVTESRITNREFQQKIYAIDKRYKEMVFGYLGIEDHPKRDKAWSIAWEDCHSEGFRAVAYKLDELSEIM